MTTRTSRTTGRPYVLLLGLIALAAAAYLLATGLAPDRNASGQCEGIGWGCTLTPRDTLLFLGFLGAIPALAIMLIVGCAVIATGIRRGVRSGPGLAVLGFCCGILACALVLAGLAVFN
jgi:hypothetical protein